MESETVILALAALAQSTRLDVFRLLVKHEPEGLAAGDIARAIAVPQNTMSSHLSILSRAGLVSAPTLTGPLFADSTLAMEAALRGQGDQHAPRCPPGESGQDNADAEHAREYH